jgi:hypothetical protein
MTTVAVLIYNFSIVAGTAYLVALHNWSGWWFVLAFLMLANDTKKTND